MFHKFHWSILTVAVILALLVSAFPLGAVMAEGEDPAPVEVPQTEEQSAATDAPLSKVEAPPLTVEEVVAHVPENVVVVPVDPSGQALPMAEEATGKSLVSGDPVYCPGIAVWGDPSCSGTLASIDLALDAAKAGPGTIYVAVDYTDLTPDPIVINGLDLWGTPGWINLIGGVDISTGEIIGRTKLMREVVVTNLSYFNMENFSITIPEITQPNINAEALITSAALTINTDGDVFVSDSDFNNNPGPGIDIEAGGMVALDNVQANNNGGGNHISSILGTVNNDEEEPPTDIIGISLFNTQFNNNNGTGLYGYSGSTIFVVCSQAKNNTGIDEMYEEIGDGGMYLQAEGNITIWCSKFTNNHLYGLVVDTPAMIYTADNTISGNGLIDIFSLNGNDPLEEDLEAPCSEICPSCKGGSDGGGEEEKPSESNTQVVIVKVGDGSGSAEIKAGYSTVFKLYEEKEDKDRLVQLTALTSGSAPDGSSAVYTPLDESKLPAPLPEGASLIPWGFNLAITNPDGSAVESLIGYMLVRFYLPEGFVLPGGMRLVIQYYDPATSSWTPMSTAVGGGMAYTFASKPGTYVLTMEPIQ